MPILHFRLSSKTQHSDGAESYFHDVNVTRNLHGQNFTFRRAIVSYAAKQGGIAGWGRNAGLILDCGEGFFRGEEVLSNFSSNDLCIPMPPLDMSAIGGTETMVTSDVRFEFDFNSEDIRESFKVKLWDWNKRANVQLKAFPATTGTLTDGDIYYVDLFFSFNELTDPDHY
jgi:hypothetical protein